MKHLSIGGFTDEQVSRFWSKVDRQDDRKCWAWLGSLTPTGYGKFFAGRVLTAHRVAYTISVGQIPTGRVLDHLCRNRACVNPAHLEPVTQRENVQRGIRCDLRPFKDVCPEGHDKTLPNSLTTQGRCRICYTEYMREYMRTYRK